MHSGYHCLQLFINTLQKLSRWFNLTLSETCFQVLIEPGGRKCHLDNLGGKCSCYFRFKSNQQTHPFRTFFVSSPPSRAQRLNHGPGLGIFPTNEALTGEMVAALYCNFQKQVKTASPSALWAEGGSGILSRVPFDTTQSLELPFQPTDFPSHPVAYQ